MGEREHLVRLIEEACGGCARYRAEDIADTLISKGMLAVVRCGECKHNYGIAHSCEFNPNDIVCEVWGTDGMDENDYCSYGERSNENAE